jgi:hypothetical protein
MLGPILIFSGRLGKSECVSSYQTNAKSSAHELLMAAVCVDALPITWQRGEDKLTHTYFSAAAAAFDHSDHATEIHCLL